MIMIVSIVAMQGHCEYLSSYIRNLLCCCPQVSLLGGLTIETFLFGVASSSTFWERMTNPEAQLHIYVETRAYMQPMHVHGYMYVMVMTGSIYVTVCRVE